MHAGRQAGREREREKKERERERERRVRERERGERERGQWGHGETCFSMSSTVLSFTSTSLVALRLLIGGKQKTACKFNVEY